MATGGLTSIEIHSDEIFDFQCTMCKRKDRNKEAERYCVECNDYYCLSCVKVHEDVPSLTGHNILNKSQFQHGSSKALLMAPTERCERHGHKLLDMYCRNHDDVCCAICLAAEHRFCHDIFYIPEFVQTNTDSCPSQDLQNKMESTIKTLTGCLNTYQHEKHQLLTRKTNLIEDIKKFRKEVNDRLDELEKNSVSNINNEIQVLTDKLEEMVEQLKSDKAKIKSAQDKIAAAGNNVSQVFVTSKIASKVANKAENIDKEEEPQADVPDFKGDSRVMSLLEEMNDLGIIWKQDISESTGQANSKVHVPIGVPFQLEDPSKVTAEYTGKVTAEHSSKVTAEHTGKVTAEHSSKVNAEHTGKVTAEHSSKVNAEHTGKVTAEHSSKVTAEHTGKVTTEHTSSGNATTEQTTTRKSKQNKRRLLQLKDKMTVCAQVESDSIEIKLHGITSCCIMKDGTVIVCDNENKKLKCLHTSTFNVNSQYKLPESPWQLCPIDDQRVAVSLGITKQVQAFSVHANKEMKKFKTIKTDHYCYGLAYSNGNVYISDSDTSIYIYNYEFGTMLRKFRNDLLGSSSLKKNIFEISLRNLAASEDGTKVYITHLTNGLMMLDVTGPLIKQYSLKQLPVQTAFCCHCLHGNTDFLVCGMGSNNVLQFGPNCELIGEVLKSEVDSVYKVACCDPQMSKMVVCQSGTYSIDIYDIQ